MSSPIKVKKGATFLLHVQQREDDGITPKSLAGVTLKSQLRDKSDVLIDDLIITVTNESAGEFTISTAIGTAHWKEGFLFCDLKQTINSVTTITDTLTFEVTKSITQS